MEKLYLKWDTEEFKAFLMIHLANVDFKISAEELELIIGQVGEERYRRVNKTWEQYNDFECLSIIQNLKEKFYPGETGKSQLIEEMISLAQADEKMDLNEKMLIHTLKRLL